MNDIDIQTTLWGMKNLITLEFDRVSIQLKDFDRMYQAFKETYERNNKAIEYCKELMLFKKNSRQYLIGKCMLKKLGGVDKE